MSYISELKEMQIDVSTPRELHKIIDNATELKQLNEIRMSCVTLMKKDNTLLKEWQTKYWSLKNCPTCGKPR